MSCFEFEITELLSRIIKVTASNEEEGYKKASEMYKNGDIVLSADDFSHVEIKEYLPYDKD